ncbi:histidine phosphatase family protein [Paenibacillus zeisoli]|uniref:Histidine phosphatase family protein n=1 Tax=Paenibacillus zeisoli TaxID=2496267 RepID=A0A433X2X0_9BACL|nr:histidine phosphatase family protein [Paenibacillus zeisoli]RUT28411.1 histidine phosphatase family protein [Paenibacillus zeisoli]
MDLTVEWIIVRHGRTEWNVERRYLGHSDIALLPGEDAVLSQLALELHGLEFSAVYSSDLRRCTETLQRVRPDLMDKVRLDRRLREMDFGAWEGKIYDMLKDIPSYREWIDHPEKNAPPGGESWDHFSSRVSQFCADAMSATLYSAGQSNDTGNPASSKRPRVLIMTHGGVVRLLRTLLLPGVSFRDYQAETGSLLRIPVQVSSTRSGNEKHETS